MKSLETLWRDLEQRPGRPVYQRVDETHPLDLYGGVDADGSLQLALISDHPAVEHMKRFKAFEMVQSVRADGRYILAVRLKSLEVRRIFAHLCDDLVEACRTDCTKEEAVPFVCNRIVRWEHLLARERSGLLGEQELRGLVGELVFLRDRVPPPKGPVEGIHAWKGPLGADHDFQFVDAHVEVKSLTSSLIVVIGSAEQLDNASETLYLAAVRLDSTMEDSVESFSVSGLVRGLKNSLAGHAETLMAFEDKLALAGYRPLPEYDDRRFVLKGIEGFAVVQGFPRLTRTMLPSGVVNVVYELDLRLCHAFGSTIAI